MKIKFIIAAVVSACMAVLSASIAYAAINLPSTTTLTNQPMQEMVRVSGPISVSIDGLGIPYVSGTPQTGNIRVEKPANSTVIAAYLTTAVTLANASIPTDIQLNGQSVTFTHSAFNTTNGGYFSNFFADVTNLVKADIDSHSAGIFTFPIDEGSSDKIEGEELIVIFDDPAKPVSSVIVVFGAAQPAGDTFSFTFPALTNTQVQKAELSVGISYSYQVGDFSQSSDISVTTSSNQTSQLLSETAGGQDDGSAVDGALMTVGGIDDSIDTPDLSTPTDDDELYSLSNFLVVGDTQVTFITQNASNNDNIFQAVLYFSGVQVAGSTTVGSTPTVVVTENGLVASGPSEAPTLAETGSNAMTLSGIGATLFFIGWIAYMARKRREA